MIVIYNYKNDTTEFGGNVVSFAGIQNKHEETYSDLFPCKRPALSSLTKTHKFQQPATTAMSFIFNELKQLYSNSVAIIVLISLTYTNAPTHISDAVSTGGGKGVILRSNIVTGHNQSATKNETLTIYAAVQTPMYICDKKKQRKRML